MTEKRQSLRWRKKPPPSGLLAMVAQPSHELRLGDVVLARATKLRQGGWYWVARDDDRGIALTNTCDEPVATAEEAKAAAMAYVKKCLAANTEEASNEPR